MRASEDRSLFCFYSFKSFCLMREHQKTEVYYLLQSEELQSDESIRRQKSIFYYSLKSVV